MLMLAALSLKGYRYTQYAARGLAPPDVARDHPELLAPNRLREAVRRTREAHEDQLPARYVTLETPVRELVRRLQSNEVVGIAFDGRIGRSWVSHDYLGRQALLSPGPYKMAVLAQSPVLPVFCHTPRSGPSVCEIGEAIEPGGDWRDLMHRTVAFQSNRLHEQPEEYGTWLLHCRIRNQIDDHPLFVDQAQDDRWKRWLR
jgi:lauroyl/myristoyl acyltransferase